MVSFVGEYISDIIVWNNTETVSAIQFVTTFGRISPHYGGNDGVPNLMNSGGGVLAGFSGRRTELDQNDVIGRIQVIFLFLPLSDIEFDFRLFGVMTFLNRAVTQVEDMPSTLGVATMEYIQ
ncbi:hypothetical protein FS749_009340 [Ceratobasidium sp. UAMH 11750]|nr:hypothetical protein FS749_009340 [Ceratobasidium sp. UAMH 11750]